MTAKGTTYNWRVFDDPLTPPYASNRAQYGIVPLLIWQPESTPPSYRHPVMRELYAEWEPSVYRDARTHSGYVIMTTIRLGIFWLFFIGPLLTIPLVIAAAHLVSLRHFSIVWITIAANTLAVALCAFTMPHYWAPATAAILIVIAASLRLLWVFQFRQRRFGRALVRATVVAVFLIAIIRAVIPFGKTRTDYEVWNYGRSLAGRSQIISGLRETGGQHLVVVRYGDRHSLHEEWVWNDADIDASPVVWAREMNPEADAKLLDYFRGRSVWLLEPDQSPVRLKPYPKAATRQPGK